jgi:hypothetical protein
VAEEGGEDSFGDRFFVAGYGEAAFDDVESAFCGAAVISRVMKYSVADAPGSAIAIGVVVGVVWEGEFAGDSVSIEDDGEIGESEGTAAFDAVEIATQEGFDACICGAVNGVESFEAVMVGAEESGGAETIMVFEDWGDGETVGEEFEDDVAGDAGAVFCLLSTGLSGNEADGFFEVADRHFRAPEKQK